jgi:hypothetical protein
MTKSRFTESQIVAILKEGEAGVALSELTRKHGASSRRTRLMRNQLVVAFRRFWIRLDQLGGRAYSRAESMPRIAYE